MGMRVGIDVGRLAAIVAMAGQRLWRSLWRTLAMGTSVKTGYRGQCHNAGYGGQCRLCVHFSQ